MSTLDHFITLATTFARAFLQFALARQGSGSTRQPVQVDSEPVRGGLHVAPHSYFNAR